jgi:hypothetical protein
MIRKLDANKTFRGLFYGLTISAAIFMLFFLNKPTTFLVTEKYTFSSLKKTNVALAVFVPESSAYQQISNLKIEGSDKFSIKDTGRMQVIMAESPIVGNQTIQVAYSLFLPKGSISWTGNTNFNDVKPQDYIESGNSELIEKSRSITDGKSIKDVRKIYNFVSTWLNWPKGSREGNLSEREIYSLSEH